ncbi:DUF3617 domain-containing protein [Roseateles sp.]|uniref:DUF3617 domain-containing protein n=1 Tax=Roseateles sp. TaxID=1971397 RepID=UPI0025DBFF84|nr:DUF3617 domain-containing protein [Roseateles sp.]MBV8036697.1 DUF3617 domain-containing protein [Roseateles sp.]
MKAPVLLLLLAGLAGLAHAQAMKPGLWELKQTPQLDPERQAQMAQAQKAMESMSPEQRKMMESMMGQHGVSMGFSGGAITIKACITKEQAERNMTPTGERGNCTHNSQRSGNVIKTRFVCTDPVGEGESTVTLKGGDGFSNQVRITRQRNGKTETTTMSGEGRWLGSDCGDIKPMKDQAKP